MLLVLAAWLVAVPALAAGVGVVTEAEGEALILRGGSYLAAAPGVDVEPHDIVMTGAGAAAQLDMHDGSLLRLGPQTRLALAEYRLDADRGVLSASLDLLAGWLRFAVAKLKPAARYELNAPVLTVGVRGTGGVLAAQDEEGGLQLEEGEVEVRAAGAEAGVAAQRVAAGEYVQRRRGRAFERRAQPPAEFTRRQPPAVRARLVQRAATLPARGVPPRVVRPMTREDAQRFLRNHPHLAERWRQRLQAPHAQPRLRDSRPPGAAPEPPPGRTLPPGAWRPDRPPPGRDAPDAERRRPPPRQPPADVAP
jgi:hypothetical protein